MLIILKYLNVKFGKEELFTKSIIMCSLFRPFNKFSHEIFSLINVSTMIEVIQFMLNIPDYSSGATKH
jgi:hypothetical protein